ncbi:MAG: hypothetical protein ABI741_01230 [Ferruginibacter sp.]
MKINRYFPFAFIYFFVNSLGLPFGLTYTAILSPLFYWWIMMERKKEVLVPFFVCLSPFLIAHAIIGVDVRTYIISITNFTAVYIFCQAFYSFLKTVEDVEKIFRRLLIINFFACLIAVTIYFTPYSRFLWMQQTITDGADNFTRLKLFTYEASYYASLLIPLFFFYFMQVILKQNRMNSWLLLCMLTIPYILSFSIGVIGCLLLSVALTYLIYARLLTKKKRVLSLLIIVAALSVSFLTILWLSPQNIIFLRFENIFTGKDTSGNGRTYEAFILAMKMLDLKSYAWGIGAGQIKILGADIIRSYYLYDLDYNTFAIPNAAAETLAIFGWVGLSIRMLIELFLFFYTRVWTNYYRLLLFIFIFLYQFTGSFITNIAEYVIWILAFMNVFPAFNVRRNNQGLL